MARHRRRRHPRRSRRGSRSLVPGISNTMLAVGAGFGYLLMTGRLSASMPTSMTGLGGTRAIGPGLGAWGRPTLPSVGGLGQFFQGYRGGLGAFHQGIYPARRWWT